MQVVPSSALTLFMTFPEMKFSVCLVLLVTVWQASAQAPGDESSGCMSQRYPPNTRMLMDSRNYDQLITGSGAVWQALDVDGTGSGWRSSFGGLCAAQPRSCDFREATTQNNWFFTQYIRYIDAREVIVNITANFQECRLNLANNPSCTQLYVDMYRYERNGMDATAARTTTNYQFLRRIEQPSGFSQQMYETSFNFTPSGNFNGFYLGFRDTGTCVNILRLQVYYIALQPPVDPPVVCPEVGRPPQGSTVPVTCSCPGNSTVTPGSSLQLTCYRNRTCDSNPSCQCNDGYREIIRGCVACPAGTYRSQSDPASFCLPCPANTITSGVAVAVCPCIAEFFRTAQENQSFGCTQPPTAVRNLMVDGSTNTSITIQWTTPTRTGRPDYYYNVEYSDPDDASRYIKHNQKEITNTNMYRVTGLRPNTTYVIRISVHNGVSGNDSANDDDRRRQVAANTEEGVPSAPPVIPGLCTVVVWNTPSQMNGVLTGYDLRFYDANREIIVSNSSDEILRIVQNTDIPTRRERTFVQVRGKTRVGAGNWSEGVSLGCNGTLAGPGQGSSTEGLVPSWYMAIAAVAACIVTAIVAIIIVLIVCVCKKNRGKSSMEKANGLNGDSRNEFNNPTYSKN